MNKQISGTLKGERKRGSDYLSQTYYAVYGKNKDVNVSGNELLAKLTIGLWDKVGIPRPLSKEDAELVARVLYNYANLMEITLEESKENAYCFWHRYGHDVLENHDIRFLRSMGEFFDNCGGLITEDEYYKLHEGETIDEVY